MKSRWSLVLAGLLILSLALAACSPEAAQQVQEAAQEVAPTIQAAAEELAPTVEAALEEVAPTVEAAVEEAMPEPTEEPMEEPTAEPVEEATPEPEEAAMGDFVGNAVVAESCDYGGKVSSIEAVDQYTVVFNLCKPDPAFLAKAAFTPFAIQPEEWLNETGGTGAILEQPVGTGAYKLESWNRGESIIMTRNEDYWGEPAIADTLVFRWATESASRLLELQSGSADYISNLAADDFAIVEADEALELVPLIAPNILYVAMTNTFEPFGDVNVRQAIAKGIDRDRIVGTFYPEGSIVATHFTPCNIPGGCEGDEWYEFNPEEARQQLSDAGFPDGFETTIYYRDVFRDYLPEPGSVAVELQTQLQENLGITANIQVMESGEFIDESSGGRLDGIYLLGWTGDYPHITNFLDFHFSASNPQFGDPHPEIYEPLEQASQIADPGRYLRPLYGSQQRHQRTGPDGPDCPFRCLLRGARRDAGHEQPVLWCADHAPD